MGLLNWLRTVIGHGGSDAEDGGGADAQDMMGWADTGPVNTDVTTGGARRTAAAGADAASTDAGTTTTGGGTASTGAGTAASGAGTAESEQARPRADYECTVCGTGVYAPGEQCPLCHSSDVVPVDGPDAAGARGASDEGNDPNVPAFGDQHVSEADDDSVEKLRELREGQGLLERHDDRWRPTAGGFRVETSDGERILDSREALVAALEAHEEEDQDDDQVEIEEGQDGQAEDANQERQDSDDQAEDANEDGDATRNSGADRTRENDGE